MKARFVTMVAATLLVLSSFVLPASAQDEEAPSLGVGSNEWRFDLMPYFWAVGLNGDLQFGPQTNRAPINLSNVFQKLEPSAGLAFQARYRAWTILFDSHFANLKESGNTQEGYVDFKMLQMFFELAGTYRVPKIPFEFILGLRVNYLSPEVTINSGTPVEDTQVWVDPIVGVRFVINYEPVYMALRASIGGFGIGSSLNWSFNALLGWQIIDWMSVFISYRFMDWSYETGGSGEEFIFNAQEYGPTLGLGFHF